MKKYVIHIAVTVVHKESQRVAVHSDSVEVTLPKELDIKDWIQQLQEGTGSIKERGLVVIYYNYTILQTFEV